MNEKLREMKITVIECETRELCERKTQRDENYSYRKFARATGFFRTHNRNNTLIPICPICEVIKQKKETTWEDLKVKVVVSEHN